MHVCVTQQAGCSVPPCWWHATACWTGLVVADPNKLVFSVLKRLLSSRRWVRRIFSHAFEVSLLLGFRFTQASGLPQASGVPQASGFPLSLTCLSGLCLVCLRLSSFSPTRIAGQVFPPFSPSRWAYKPCTAQLASVLCCCLVPQIHVLADRAP